MQQLGPLAEEEKSRPTDSGGAGLDLGVDIEDMQNSILGTESFRQRWFASSSSTHKRHLDERLSLACSAECFLQADKDGSGTIDRKEFKDLIQSLGFPLSRGVSDRAAFPQALVEPHPAHDPIIIAHRLPAPRLPGSPAPGSPALGNHAHSVRG